MVVHILCRMTSMRLQTDFRAADAGRPGRRAQDLDTPPDCTRVQLF